ncbi:leucine-rich repeat domain-containing protein [Dehalococcoidia bacterium]|nr:leucine-rich repeat domain-containing protein [Dehalococcoidia bacterium]
MFTRDRKLIIFAVAFMLLGSLIIGCPYYGNTVPLPLAELKPPVEPPMGPVISFPDPNLEAAIREALEEPYRDIHRSDLERFIAFRPSNRDISNLEGLQWAVNLEELWLAGNQIRDIGPVSNLINLDHLRLEGNQIRDINPLSNLLNLRFLWLGGNQIKDISPLSRLATNLTHLHLDGNQISDISPLSSLVNLRELGLAENEITDISPLSSLTNLRALSLRDNQIRDINPLSRLIDLLSLDLSRNQISDLSPLVQNRGLGDEAVDMIWVIENPLSGDSINVYIPQLEERGVVVVLER